MDVPNNKEIDEGNVFIHNVHHSTGRVSGMLHNKHVPTKFWCM